MSTSRVVAGIVIEKGVPIAPKQRPKPALLQALEALQVGESFELNVSRARPYALAQKLGIGIVVRKVDGKTRIWRVS